LRSTKHAHEFKNFLEIEHLMWSAATRTKNALRIIKGNLQLPCVIAFKAIDIRISREGKNRNVLADDAFPAVSHLA